MRRYKRVTIQDIANKAKVSYATVSKVLSGKTGGNIRVSEQTRERILKISSELGYVPNHMARNLKNSDASLVSVFTYEDMSNRDVQKEFYDFYSGVHLKGEEKGLDILLLNTRKNIASSSRVTLSSGAVMIGVERDDADIKALLKRNFPLVFVGRREICGVETFWVSFDYKSVILQIGKALKKQNISQALFIESSNSAEPYTDKSHALFSAAQEFGIEIETMTLSDKDKLSTNQKELLCKHDFYLLDRIWQIDTIETYLNDNSFILGKDKMGVLLEDDWLEKGKWTCWTQRRKELGALAVEFLDAIMKGKELPGKNLCPLDLIFKDSFRMDTDLS